jgi:hypothetical protein
MKNFRLACRAAGPAAAPTQHHDRGCKDQRPTRSQHHGPIHEWTTECQRGQTHLANLVVTSLVIAAPGVFTLTRVMRLKKTQKSAGGPGTGCAISSRIAQNHGRPRRGRSTLGDEAGAHRLVGKTLATFQQTRGPW